MRGNFNDKSKNIKNILKYEVYVISINCSNCSNFIAVSNLGFFMRTNDANISNANIIDKNLTKVARVKYKVKTTQISEEIEIPKNKLLIFENTNNNIDIYIDNDHLNAFSNNIKDTMGFLIPFQRLKVSFNEVSKLKNQIDNLLDEVRENLKYWEENITDLENEQNLKIEEYQSDIERFTKEKEEKIARKEFRDHTGETAIKLAEDNREGIVKEEKEFQKRIEGNIEKAKISKLKSEENLEKILEQKAGLDEFKSRLDDLQSQQNKEQEDYYENYKNFIGSIDDLGNILTQIDLVDSEKLSELSKLLGSLITYYNDLGQIDIDLLKLYQELKKNGELIELNKQIADVEIKLAVKIIEIPFLEAEEKLAEERLQKDTDRYKALVIYDTVAHLQNNVRDLNSNSQALGEAINGIMPSYRQKDVVTSVNVHSASKRVVTSVREFGKETTVGYGDINHVSGVNASYGRINYVSDIYIPRVSLIEVNPLDVQLSAEAQEAYNTCKRSSQKLEGIRQEIQQKYVFEEELRNLNNRPWLMEQKNAEEIQQRSLYHNQQSTKYQNLLRDFDISDNGIKGEYVDALIGVVLSESTVEQKVKCCFCIKIPDKPAYLNTSITLNQFYDVFSQVLRDQHGIKNKWCVSPKQRVHSMDLIDLSDVIKLFTELRFVGSLKNSNGEKQNVVNKYLREEDVEDSLFNVISKTIGINLLQKKIELGIDKQQSLEEIDNWCLIGQAPWIDHDNNASGV